MPAKNDATGNMVEIRRANGRECVSSTKFPKPLGVVRGGLDIERFGIGGLEGSSRTTFPNVTFTIQRWHDHRYRP
jgi:hypothetical protein